MALAEKSLAVLDKHWEAQDKPELESSVTPLMAPPSMAVLLCPRVLVSTAQLLLRVCQAMCSAPAEWVAVSSY